MNALLKRRQLIMTTLVVALGAAVFVNWYFTKTPDPEKGDEGTSGEYVQSLGEAKYVNSSGVTVEETTEEKSDEESFARLRLNRSKAHDEALDSLKSSLDSVSVDSEVAESVAKSVDELSALIKTEADTEALISAKIGAECVVIINNDKVQVLVEKGRLDEKTVVLIADIISANTDIEEGNLTVSEI